MANEANETDAAGDRLMARQRLKDAEVGLARALGWLDAARRATLRGACGPDELDRARVEYRAAEKRAAEERARWSGAPGMTNAGWEESSAAFVPTRRQEFARWLYRAGRISDSV